jgi:methyltransferase (TIGR00027 family)
MSLPDLSYMMTVGQLRYIQSRYETGQFRNPDALVGDLLPALERWGCDFRGRILLDRLRSQPFYYYVVARTQYYDSVFLDAIFDKADFIVNIGCGSDTRAYRFGHILRQKGVRVLECDQAAAINAKRQMAANLWRADHVEYLPIDLNGDAWPELEHWVHQKPGARMLVMLEGVSPYVNEDSFGLFLDFLARTLQPGSRLAYDFKLSGIAEGFGLSERTQRPFRLGESQEEVAAFHRAHDYELECMELSSDLSLRLLPDLQKSATQLFREDSLVRLLLPNR